MNLFLYIISRLYLFLIFVWSKLYDYNIFKSKKFEPKIISIGNIVVGGAGKTPMIIFFSSLLKKEGIKHAIISRGYKKKKGGSFFVSDSKKILINNPSLCGEEPLLLAKKLPKIPVLVGEEKIASIKLAIKKEQPQIILIDDGFQSRKIHVDYNVVLIDSLIKKEDFRFLPFGTLREPLSSLKRSNLIIVTKTNFKASGRYAQHAPMFLSLAEKARIPIIKASYIETFSVFNKKTQALHPLSKDAPVDAPSFLLSGIARQESFQIIAKKKYSNIVKNYRFADHHHYAYEDLFPIFNKETKKQSKVCITTYKDFIKIQLLENLIKDFSIEFHVIDVEHKLSVSSKKIIENNIKKLI